jgi:hypothetical protein
MNPKNPYTDGPATEAKSGQEREPDFIDDILTGYVHRDVALKLTGAHPAHLKVLFALGIITQMLDKTGQWYIQEVYLDRISNFVVDHPVNADGSLLPVSEEQEQAREHWWNAQSDAV